jgi:RNA polymerase sigma-70 factor (ECF subfamily)
VLAIALSEPFDPAAGHGSHSFWAREAQAQKEWELVQRAQHLDERALAAIYEQFYPRIYSYALLQTGDTSLAEDIASEVMLKVLEALPRYRFRGAPLAAWIYRIAHNCVVDHHRRRRRRQEVRLDETAPPPAAHNPEGGSDLSLQRHDLQRALQRLTYEQRQVIILKFVQGLDNRTIARVMGRSEGSVKSLQHRALKALERLLAEGEG